MRIKKFKQTINEGDWHMFEKNPEKLQDTSWNPANHMGELEVHHPFQRNS